MDATSTTSAAPVLADLGDILPTLEASYKDIHAHPELSMQEHRTAAIAAKHLADHGFEVTTGSAKPASSGCFATATGRR